MGFKSILSALFVPGGTVAETDRGAALDTGDSAYDFALSGSLDRRSAPNIRKLIFEEALRHREIRIDLSGLRRIDTAGMATLVEAFAAARREGVKMAFHGPSEPIRRALRLTRLDQVFPILDSVALPKLPAMALVRPGPSFSGRTRLPLPPNRL